MLWRNGQNWGTFVIMSWWVFSSLTNWSKMVFCSRYHNGPGVAEEIRTILWNFELGFLLIKAFLMNLSQVLFLRPHASVHTASYDNLKITKVPTMLGLSCEVTWTPNVTIQTQPRLRGHFLSMKIVRFLHIDVVRIENEKVWS